jgi:hypothetical protein
MGFNIDELEHDSGEDGGKVPARKTAPPEPRLSRAVNAVRKVRDALRSHIFKGDPKHPWCDESNPAIWQGDVSDLYEDS